MSTTTVSATLKRARRRKGYTQAQLATLAGMNQGHISRIERGRAGISGVNARALAAALDVPAEHFEGFHGKNGLHELASDLPLVKALRITRMELATIDSIKLPAGVTKEGYLHLLMAVRTAWPRRRAAR